jgi:RNA-directed DNA polymerase
VAGAERVEVQRGQEADRPRLAWIRLSRVQRPPLSRQQATDQAERQSGQAVPGTARSRDARLRGSNAAAVIARLAPVTRGWAAYYRGVVSSKLFASLDHYLFKLTYKWARRSHENKPTSWIVDRYYGKFNRFRNDRWVFGDRDSGAYLPKLAWTGIVPHIPVKGGASLDDPGLAEYWADRRRKVKPPLGEYRRRLLAKQGARCPLCGDSLLSADQPPQSPHDWERWWRNVTRKAIVANYLAHHGVPGPTGDVHNRLVHVSCHRAHLAHVVRQPALHPTSPSRLA